MSFPLIGLISSYLFQESNAGRVETVLLDHVRVVWPGQVMPVWIQRSVCIYMTIGKV